MSRGGYRENSGRKIKSEMEKTKFIRKSISFSEKEDMELLNNIEKYGVGENFSQKIKFLLKKAIYFEKNY